MTLELEGLTKVYKDKTALDDVSFSFTPGIYGLLGPNGAGKSTMMNLISDNLILSFGSSPAVGSSSIRMPGLPMSACAISALCFIPPCLLYTSDAADE